MKRRTFLGGIGAFVGLLFPKWSNNVNADIANIGTEADNPLSVFRDHSLDAFPIVYETDKRPPNIVSVSRLLCRIQKGGIYDRWFYHHARPGIYYPAPDVRNVVYTPAPDARNTLKYFQYLNGCNHSDFYFSPQFGEKSIDDAVCSRIESCGFLNSWTVSDWSFLQEDGSWRNWNTFCDPITGNMNDFCPATLAMRPYPPFCVAEVRFLNRYDFMMLVYVNGDKTDKIRMNGYAGKAGWERGIKDDFTYEYNRFCYSKFISAHQWLDSEYFFVNARRHDIDILRLSKRL